MHFELQHHSPPGGVSWWTETRGLVRAGGMGLSCLTGATTSQKSSPSAVSRQKQNFHFLIIQFCMGCPSLMIRVFSLSKSLSPSYELMKCVQVALGPCCLPNRLPWDQVEDGQHCGTKTIAGLSSPANILIHEIQV